MSVVVWERGPITDRVFLKSKLVVLSSLSSFLRKAISSPHSQSETSSSFWYMASSFSTHAEFLSFCSLIHPRHSTVSDKSINDIEWSDARQPDIDDFVGTFDYAWESQDSEAFSLSELGEVGKAVDLLTRDSERSQSNSITSRLAVSVCLLDCAALIHNTIPI